MSKKMTRREALKIGGLTAGGALLGEEATRLMTASAQGFSPAGKYEVQLADNTIYSACLQCNTGCPIKVKLLDGVAYKIDGNPITPWTMYPHLPMKTGVQELASIDGSLCPKGQAGVQSAYDPYRIRKVLKRAGPRGSGKWSEIPFDQAVAEIAKGGALFASIGDQRQYPGLEEYWAIRDPKVLKDMGDAVTAIWAEKDAAKKKALVEKFKLDFKDHLGAMIDPDHPDLGPKNNQIAFAWGRLKGGRSDFIKWFFSDGLGTTNLHGHTTVCQGSLYFTGKAMSEQLTYDGKGKYSWTGGDKFYWQAELSKAKFVIFVGTNIFEANYGPPLRVNKLTQGSVDGDLKYVIIDPRGQKGIKGAARWIAPKSGTDAAIALGMIRWILESGRYDAKFLSAANKAAAKKVGEASWTNATWLVKMNGNTAERLLRASDLGLPKWKRTHDGKEVEFDPPLAMVNGQPTPVDPNSETEAVVGELWVNTRIGNLLVKSGMQLIKEEASAHSLAYWANLAGITAEEIEWLAKEFSSYGKRAVADVHRGVSQHTNGFYNTLAWFTLNALVGNYDWQGGLVKLSTYDTLGAKAAGPYDLGKLHPKKLSPFGISIIRHGVKYEDTTLFAGYPSKRTWYPHASDIYQEVLPSAAQGYPYPIKILFHYMGTPAYALPAGQTQIEAMLNPDKIGLIVGSDITVGESYMYADYVFPDLSYLERWEFHGSHPSNIWKVQPVRQPAIAPIPESVKVFGEEMPISLEAMLLGLAEKLGVPGFGEKGFSNNQPLKRAEDFYLKQAANLAFGERSDGSQALPEASDEEVRVFLAARRHLPATVFDATKWRSASGEAHWKRVVYLLNRGGRYQDFAGAFASDGSVSNKYAKQINLFLDKQVTSKNSMTGKPYYPIATFIPPYQDVLGRDIRDLSYGLKLLTFKQITMTKSRTISNYWLTQIHPDNHFLVAAADAARLGLKDGQMVRATSATNPKGLWNLGNGTFKAMDGKVKIVQGMRPGHVAFSLGYGHWAYGATDLEINGTVIKGDARRGRGVHANAAMRVDPVLGDMTLTDVVGASAVFYDTRINLVPVG